MLLPGHGPRVTRTTYHEHSRRAWKHALDSMHVEQFECADCNGIGYMRASVLIGTKWRTEPCRRCDGRGYVTRERDREVRKERANDE